jgi:hypothetical protein
MDIELDRRIYNIEDIQSVVTSNEDDIGKKGYFSNSILYYKTITSKKLVYGALESLKENDKCFVTNSKAYRYFIPEEDIMPIETLEEILRQEELERNKSQEEIEEEQDYLDFCKIFFVCSGFDSRGNFQPGKWSKLENTEFPFSEERKNYLMMKFVFGITDPKDNPRVAE